MRVSRIAFRNVRCHPARTALLVVMIMCVVAVVATLFLVTRSADSDLANKVDEYGANIAIVPRSEQLPLVYGGIRVGGLTYDVKPLSMGEVALIRTITNKENINRVAPKLLQLTEIDGTRLMAVGVVWEEELAIKKWWRIEGSAPTSPEEVLLGARAAERLDLRAGASLELKGERFRVSGVLDPTGGQEDDVVFMDLAAAQGLWDRAGQVSFVEVSAWCSSCPIETISAQIATLLPNARVSALRKAMEPRELLVGQFKLFSILLSAFMVLAGSMIVLTSTLGRVRERKSEIGVFRALGYRRKHILEIVLLENLIVAVFAAAVGVAVAWAAAGPVARSVAGVVTATAPGPLLLLAAVAAAVLMVVLASLYPAWRASRLSPLLALRRV
ncbi:MAG: FtsX-like permease family protein [bacterium]